MQEACDRPDARPGAVICVQTFGSLLDYHPHCHTLFTWGLFGSDGAYIGMPEVDDEFVTTVESLFRHRVFRMLLKEEAITEDVVENMLSWKHSGFHVHVGRMVAGNDGKSLESLGEYMVRGPVALERISLSDDGDRVILDGGKHHPRHGGQHRIMDPLAFMAELCCHIPNTHEKSVIYYGHYSHRARGERKKAEPKIRSEAECAMERSEAECAMEKEEPAPEHIRANWARLIQKVYEIDPLICPKCGGVMKIIAFIEEEEVIYKILTHLDLLGRQEVESGKRLSRGPPEITLDYEYAQVIPDDDIDLEQMATAGGF
jgi:hypothetical protein